MNETTLLDSLPISEHWKVLLSNPIFKLGMIVGSEWASKYYEDELSRVESEAYSDVNDAYERGLADGNTFAQVTPSHPIIASVFLSTSF